FTDSSFDAVICSEVLEHIDDDDLAVSELVRILKPGRILAISVPRFLPEKICWLLSDAYHTTDMGHVRIYCKNALVQKFLAKNMTFAGSHFAHSIHTPYWWLKCLTGPDRTDVPLVNLYHKLLVWELMQKPASLCFVDQLLNPVLGKSLVLYFKKV
ncbi:MAG: class I SAM-dependent methyltransferase, partial [Desulfobacteraceae bacterium]|nr:class I SAM-dependent methyltransferase [Desulfobacteraceae bacterium]